MITNTTTNTTTNTDPINGIHYGTIYANHIMSEAVNDLIYFGEDLDYAEGLKQVREDFESHIQIFCDDNYITFERLDISNILNQIENAFGEHYESNDATYEYIRDGYIIEFHTYDNSLIILKSPYVCYAQGCSPCFPNGGYIKDKGDLLTYALGNEWYDKKNPLTNPIYLLQE